LVESRDHRLAEVRAALADAERAKKMADEALVRVRRDYQAGKLAVGDWNEQRPQLTEEADAAAAEVNRLRSNETEVGRDPLYAFDDAEQTVLEQLASLRRAIAGEVRDAQGTDAARAALMRLVQGF